MDRQGGHSAGRFCVTQMSSWRINKVLTNGSSVTFDLEMNRDHRWPLKRSAVRFDISVLKDYNLELRQETVHGRTDETPVFSRP